MSSPFRFGTTNVTNDNTKNAIIFTFIENKSNIDNISRFVISPTWRLEYTLLAVMISALAFIGVVGNIPVLIVYFRRRDNLVSNTFIKVLAFIDLLVCSFVMTYTIVYELHLVTSDVACRFCEFIRHFTIFASSITLVAIATERYIAVCQIGMKLNVNNINFGVWIIFGVSAILSIPSVGTFAVVHDSDVKDIKCNFPHELTSGKFCHFTYLIMGKTLVTAYQALTLITFAVTFTVIAILYSVIYTVLWKRSNIRQRIINRKITTDTESSSDVLYTEPCQPPRDKRTRNRIRKNSNGSSACDRTNKSTIRIQNDEISTELISDNLSERQDFQTTAKNNLDNQTEGLRDKAISNGKPVRRKIKFSVSAQSGRSEKIKRKKYYHRRTAKMLFLCTVIYIVTWLPFFLDIFGLTNSLILRYMFFIGNATNPIVYGIVNEQVRRAFRKLFFECLRKWFRSRKNSECGEDSLNLSGTSLREVPATK